MDEYPGALHGAQALQMQSPFQIRPTSAGSGYRGFEFGFRQGAAAMRQPISVPREEGLTRIAHEMVELPLLLTNTQAEALEQAAHLRGMTVAHMVRGILRLFLSGVNAKDQQVPSSPG